MPKHQLCRNCGHEIDHNYCPACGQRTTTDRLTWASLVDSVSSTFIGDEAYGLRGINMRKGAVMTWLAILIRPYVSVSEFILGHRRKYFNPVAILLMLSTFYAVVFALVGKEFTPTARADSPLFRWLICSYYDYATLHPAANMLLMLPFYALAMKTVFRRRSDLKYVEYLYIGIFLSVFEITLMILALPAELFIPWYSSFYMQMLPVFIYTGFVFRKLFGLKKKGAVLRTLLANGLQYVYAFFAALGLLTLSLGIYYLVAPEKFKEELNIRNRDARTEQVEGSQQGEGALNDILNGFLDGLLHEDEADKSSGKDGEDTAGTRDEPQKDVPENRPETEKTAAAGDNPPAGNTAGRQGGGKTLPGK